jgi:hypothetical protein
MRYDALLITADPSDEQGDRRGCEDEDEDNDKDKDEDNDKDKDKDKDGDNDKDEDNDKGKDVHVHVLVHATRIACAFLLAFVPLTASAQTEAPPLRERALFGAYAPGVPYYPQRALPRLERKLGVKLAIVSGFVDWDYVLGESRDQLLAAGGRKLLYSWEPHCAADGHCITFRDVIAGELDGYFERVAASMRRFPHQIYVRPWAEMNASWSPYRAGSGRPGAGSAEEFKQAWRHLYDFFRARGVHNLRFVFNTDAELEQGSADVVHEIWPGADYVDVLGIDGYNWGESGLPGGNSWREFDAIFTPMYRLLTSLHPSAPVWICEFGSKEPRKSDGSARSPAPPDPAHSKARWLENALASTAFPRMEALVYYNAYTPERDNQRDFRLESSRASLAAIRRQLRPP